MKKKLLIALILTVAFVCLLAIGVSAKTITYEGEEIELVDNLGDPSWYTGNTALAIQDKESIVILKDSDGNMTAYPSYYILKFGVDVKDGVVTDAYVLWADQNGVDYSFVNEKASKAYESGSIYYIEFPYGMIRCKNNSIFGKDADAKPEPNVVEIVLPDSVTVMDQQAFRRMNSCKKITMSKNLASIPDWAFCGSAKLETVVFPEGSVLETTGNSFSGCSSLSSINLENCTSLKVLGTNLFNSCTSLHYINLPDSIEAIRDQAFYKIGKLELASDYLPKNLTTIGGIFDQNGNENGHFLSGCTLINETLYFPEGFTSLTSAYNFNDGFAPNTHLTLVFLGKMTNINISNTALVAWTNYGSKKPLTIVLAQNSFDDLNGEFVQSVDYNGQHAYIATTGSFTSKTDGTLTLSLQNNDPNSSTQLGTDENGDKIFSAVGAPANIIFCGGDTVEYCYSVRNSTTYASGTWYRFFTTERTYDLDAHQEAGVHWDKIDVISLVNCGYDGVTKDTCVACKRVVETIVEATGDHKYTDDNDCTTSHTCTVCEKVVVEALAHILKEVYKYDGGYFSVGSKVTSCTNDGCKHSIAAEIPALFSAKGVTIPEETKDAIAHAIIVNSEAIEAYARNINATIKYGVVAGLATGTNDPVKADGSANGNAIVADFTKTEYSNLQIKIASIDNPTKGLYCSAYVIIGEEVIYLQNGTQSTSATIVTLEYPNGIPALQPTSVKAIAPQETKQYA